MDEKDDQKRANLAKLDGVRTKIAKSLADPRPSVLAEEVFTRVEAILAARRRAPL